MRTIGGVIVGLGILWIILALNMDTSVPVDSVVYGSPDSVHNIGLIADRQNHLLLGCLTTIIGILMVLLGGKTQPPVKTVSDEPPCERDLGFAPYKIWLIERYGITRNDVLGHFIFENRAYASVDEALVVAHNIESEKKKISDLIYMEELNLREKNKKEARKIFKENKFYIFGSLIFSFILFITLLFISDKLSEIEDNNNSEKILADTIPKLNELKNIGFYFNNNIKSVDITKGNEIKGFDCTPPSSIGDGNQKLNAIKQFKIKFNSKNIVNEKEFYMIVSKLKKFGYKAVDDGAWSNDMWDKKMGVGSFSGLKLDGGEIVKLRLIEAINSADVCIFKK